MKDYTITTATEVMKDDEQVIMTWQDKMDAAILTLILVVGSVEVLMTTIKVGFYLIDKGFEKGRKAIKNYKLQKKINRVNAKMMAKARTRSHS